MNPAGQLASIIELVEQINKNPQKPADAVIQSYFRNRRYIGSSDRRTIGDSVYGVLRHYTGLKNALEVSSERLVVFAYYLLEKTIPLDALEQMVGHGYGPSPLSDSELLFLKQLRSYNPFAMEKWLEDTIGDKELIKSLHEQAPFDIRVNTLKNTRDFVLKSLIAEEFNVSPTPLSPVGIRFGKRKPLDMHKFWQDGTLEVQDEASQIVGLLCAAKPGMQVLDYCAGAGGKSLSIAADMQNKGNLILSDIYPHRLQRAKERLRRAGVTNYQLKDINQDHTWFKRQYNRFDLVMVDAPCTGTGTLRRNPDLKNRLNPTDLEELCELQRKILEQAQKFVKVGGRLVYATCSVLQAENSQQSEWFLNTFQGFIPVSIENAWQQTIGDTCPFRGTFAQFLPDIHGTDGFFISIFERKE